MKTYQTIIAYSFLLASLIFSCSKSNHFGLTNLKPAGEYSKYFKNNSELIENTEIIKERHPIFGFGLMYRYEYDQNLLVYVKYHKERVGYLMRLKDMGDGRYKYVGIVDKKIPSKVSENSIKYYKIIPRDMDSDGDLDLIISEVKRDNLEQKIKYFENLKQGEYIDRGVIASFKKTHKSAEHKSVEVSFIATDHDKDGDLDLIVTDNVLMKENKGILIENNLPQKNLK